HGHLFDLLGAYAADGACQVLAFLRAIADDDHLLNALIFGSQADVEAGLGPDADLLRCEADITDDQRSIGGDRKCECAVLSRGRPDLAPFHGTGRADDRAVALVSDDFACDLP